MLQLFRTNQLLFSFLLVFYAALLHWGPAPATAAASPGIWTAQLRDWITGPLARYGFGVVLLTVQATYLNYLVARNRLTREVGQLPGLFYILVANLLPAFLGLSGPLLANTFVIIAYGELSDTYKRAKATGSLFNAGLWLGVASLFYFGYLLFLPWVLFGSNSLRKPSAREWLVTLLGAVCAYWLVGVGYYWSDAYPYFRAAQLGQFGLLDLVGTGRWTDYLALGFVGALLLYTLGQAGRLLSRTTIDVRKKINLLYTALLFGPLVLVLQSDLGLEGLLVLAVPLGALLGIRFLGLRPAVAEAGHLLLLVAVLVWRFRRLFV